MDTRSRKFDRSWITKSVCFFLALLFIALGASKVISVVVDMTNDEKIINNRDYVDASFSNVFTQGKHFELTTSEMFYREFRLFINDSTNMAMIYGDGSEKAYNDFLKRKKEVFESRIEKNIEYFIGDIYDSGDTNSRDVEFFISSVMKNNCVKAEKIADLPDGSRSMCILYNNGSYSYSYYDDDYDYDEEYATTAPSAPPESVATGTSVTLSVVPANDDTIPDSIFSLAGKCDAVVLLNKPDVNYRGYYKITVDREKFAASHNYGEDFVDGDYDDFERIMLTSFESYDDFKKMYETAKANLAQYENMFYTVTCGDKVISTNMSGLKKGQSFETAKKKFEAYSWRYISGSAIDTETGGDFKKSTGLRYNLAEYEELWETASETYGDDYAFMIAFDEELNGNDAFSAMSDNYKVVYNYMSKAIAMVSVCLLGFFVCLVILIIKSGRRSDDDEMHMRPTDSIFTLLRIAINGGIITGLCVLVAVIFCAVVDRDTWFAVQLVNAGFVLACVLTIAFFIDLVLYITRHIKNHTLIKNIFIVWAFRKFGLRIKERREERKEKRAARPAVYRDIFNDVLRKVVLFLILPNTVSGFLVLIFAGCEEWFMAILLAMLLLVYDIVVVVRILKYAYSLRKVFYKLEQVRQGNYDVKVDTEDMPSSVKAYAQAVNSIEDGLKKAVENAVKEEKTRTELITNVSHDLKTPLTSIINYVDLLSRCNIQDAEAQSYIEVLGEKSARLKRLIEDLVEASKATSNNIKVNLVSFSLNELIMQITGEYEDEFEARGLSLVVDGLETDMTVLADSRMSYRILENLMNNVKKYAMPGTRVYLSAAKENRRAVITLRNISEKQLNIPVSELMKRFVRGDASRSTEGSGLGLSIAESFSRLQGGKLTLEISGDLFTARVEFVLSEDQF